MLFDNEGELSTEKENLFVFSVRVKKGKQKLKSFLDMKFDSEAEHNAPLPNTENVKIEVELPKLILKKFSRDTLEFKETYEAAIR